MKLHTILPVILGVSIFLLGLVVYSHNIKEKEEEDNFFCASHAAVILRCDSNGDEFTGAIDASGVECRPESYSVNGKKRQYCSCGIEYISGKYKGMKFWQYKDEKDERYILRDGERFYPYPTTYPPCANDN